jgi:LysM repeat protein
VVQRGETLFRIALKYNTTVAALLRVNPDIEDPDEIQAGMVINLPIFIPAYPDCYNEYTVKQGDTLFSLAQRFNTTIDELVFYNNILNPDLIYPGRILIIPCPEEEITDLDFETVARDNETNFRVTLEERFFIATSRSQLRRILNNYGIPIPRGVNLNNNIIIGALEYDIRNLALTDRNIRVVVDRKARGYHLIQVPKNQFPRQGIYNVNFVARGGESLDRERVDIDF